MLYHRNRLIKAYEKVGCQLKVGEQDLNCVSSHVRVALVSKPQFLSHFFQSSGQRAGVGVIGVIECNFLKPAHNKQDFEYTKEYRFRVHTQTCT